MKSKFISFIILLVACLSSCEVEEPHVSYTKEKEIISVLENSNIEILFNSEIPAVVSRASQMAIVPAAYPVGVSHIEVISNDDIWVSGAGETIKIIAYGQFQSLDVRLYDYLGGSVIWNGTITGNGIMGEIDAIIPRYSNNRGDGYPIYIFVQYLQGASTWDLIKTLIQEPANFYFYTDIDLYIPYEGIRANINYEGDFPSEYTFATIRAIDENGVVIGNPAIIQPPFLNSAYIDIPENGDSNVKEISFQYSYMNSNQWENFERWGQLGKLEYIVIQEGYAEAVPAAEADHRIYFRGEFETLQVRARAITQPYYNNSYITGTANAVKSSGTYKDFQYDGYATIRFPAIGPYNGWTPNIDTNIFVITQGFEGTWLVEYYNGEEWVEIISILGQEHYYLRVVNQHASITIPKNGGNWILSVQGHYIPSNIQLRPVDGSGNVIGSVVTATMNHGYGHTIGTSELINLPVFANTSSSTRTVYLQYSIDGGVTWTTWYNYGQGREKEWYSYPTGLGNTVQQL